MQTSMRVLIADDHWVVRNGLAALLQDAGMEVVGMVSNGQEALEQAAELQPHIVLMDIDMPVMDGLEATRQLCLTMPEVKVLMLTLHAEPGYIEQAKQAGAAGYALKNDNGDKLLRTINAVGDGLCVSPHVAATRVPSRLLVPLSPREKEVVILVAKGKQSGEIARILGIETRTVEAHRQKIRDKGLRTVADQTRYAIEQGWV